jgi:hypothetical protein
MSIKLLFGMMTLYPSIAKRTVDRADRRTESENLSTSLAVNPRRPTIISLNPELDLQDPNYRSAIVGK